jgi:hypothetical protein
MTNETLKLMQSIWHSDPNILVYYKYIHGSFHIDNEIYYYFKNIIT